MSFLLYLSNFVIPFVILYIVAYGMIQKTNVYDEFVNGAEDGFRVVKGVAPTLIGLMVAIGILRASGTLDMISNFLKPVVERLHFPAELFPLVTVKMFSSSAATSLLLDVYKNYGADSYLGRLASILMSCSETIFYTISIYFMTAKVKKTCYTLAGALVATLAGIVASVWLMGI